VSHLHLPHGHALERQIDAKARKRSRENGDTDDYHMTLTTIH
jgi:hypothetical protein